MALIESARTLWDDWFDNQYDLVACIDKAVEEQAKGKGEPFKVALYSALIEHCAEQMRSSIDLTGASPDTEG